MHESLKGITDPTLAALLSEEEAAQALANAARARVREYLVICATPPEAADNDTWPANAGHLDLITVAEGATILGCSTDTAYRYCAKYDLGKEHPVGWRMSHKRIAAFRRHKSAK